MEFSFHISIGSYELSLSKMPSRPQVCGYCFTINNPTPDDLQRVRTIPCAYIIFGFEIGENNTPHLQGYIHFERSKRFSHVKQLLPRAHIEIRNGTVEQAITYCKKDGTYEERGVPPLSQKDASKKLWADLLAKAESGQFDWIKENYPRMWIQFSTKFESLHAPKTTVLTGDIQHEWWVGPTGSGKSSSLWRLYPQHFQKATNKWWCGYAHEEVVAIEEWSPKNECTGAALKIWADRYPFSGEIKGGTLKRIRPIKIIVLSNYELEDCFLDRRDYEPLKRRFTVFRFPDDLSLIESRARSFHRTQLESMVDAVIPSPPSVPLSPLSDLDLDIDLGFLDDLQFEGGHV